MTWLADAATTAANDSAYGFFRWVGTNFGFGGIVCLVLLGIGRKALIEMREEMRQENRRNREATDDASEAILECTMALPFIANEHRKMMEGTHARIQQRRKAEQTDSKA